MDLIAEIINHTFTWLDLLGWASFITVVVGKWLVIQKKWEGFATQTDGQGTRVLQADRSNLPLPPPSNQRCLDA